MMTPDTSPHSVTRVDGQAITLRDMADAVGSIEAALAAGRGVSLFTLNLDHLVKRRQSAAFRAIYARATHVTADGWPVVALARRRMPGLRRTTGADLVLPLCRMAAQRGFPITFFGSSDPILARAANELRRLCPGLDIRGWDAPGLGFDAISAESAQAVSRIATSGARLCFVALGAPKQEAFADVASRVCPDVGFICIGAALDFLAGAQHRAPWIMQAIGLEWTWRLARDPRRLGLRYWRCALLFGELLVGALRPARPAA